MKLVDTLPSSLTKAFEARTCIPFVGSGLSAALGLPTWDDAIEALAARCRQEKRANPDVVLALRDDGDYPQAAQRALDKLGRSAYREELRQLFGRRPNDPRMTTQALLWQLRPPLIITTNFDTVLEDAAPQRPEVVTPLHKSKLVDLFSLHARPTLFKIHGTIEDPESIIFTTSDYDRLYKSDQAYDIAFRSPLLANTILFLGFGLRDQAILATLESLFSVFKSYTAPHYALVRRGEAAVEAFWSRYNVQVILYQSHDEIAPLLADLVDHIKSALLRTDEDRVDKKSPFVEGMVCDVVAAASRRVRLGPGRSLTNQHRIVRDASIDDCIFLAGYPNDFYCKRWTDKDIVLKKSLSFYQPAGALLDVKESMDQQFEVVRYVTTPRYSLVDLLEEPNINFRGGGLTLGVQLTDWSLVHGVQEVLENEDRHIYGDVWTSFWRSVLSLVADKRAYLFPHHLAVHCLVITADNRVVLNKRVGVSNQRTRISASFEEQMTFPHIYDAAHGRRARYFDGDETPFDTAIRGAREELNVELDRKDIYISALCLEATSIAANLLAVAKVGLTLDEVYRRWNTAIDRQENLMVPPELAPTWTVENMKRWVSDDEVLKDTPYAGYWHASSRARIVLGLVNEFGREEVKAHFALPGDDVQR